MIQKWLLKAFVQKTISYLPYKTKINYFFQKHVTKGVLLTDDYFELKVINAQEHLDFFNKYSADGFEGKTTLELGTGWYPIVPITLFLNGFENVISLDYSSSTTKETMIATLDRFMEWEEDELLEEYVKFVDEDRWAQLEDVFKRSESLSLEEICAALSIKLIVTDARSTNFKTGSIDFISSDNTFEHINPSELKDILKEFKRIIAPKGVMSHFIDLSDHFSYFDPSITIYNFLQYSKTKWAILDNSIQPQNRLRWKDYQQMYQSIDLPYVDELVRTGDLEALERITPDEMYANYSKADLAISHGYLVTIFEG